MAKRRLYSVNIDTTVYVLAEDEYDAECVVCDNARDIFDQLEDGDLFPDVVDAPNEIIGRWQNAIPFGEQDDDRTCLQIATEQAENTDDLTDDESD